MWVFGAMHQYMQWQWSFAELVFKFLCDGGEVSASEPMEVRVCECLVSCINSCSGSGVSLGSYSSFCTTAARSVLLSQWRLGYASVWCHASIHAVAVVFR